MTTIRRPGAASAAVLIGLCASMLGAHLIAPEWARGAGLDVWNYAALETEKLNAAEVREEMEARAERHARRRALADQLAARLLTRDATLGAVGEELFELYSDDIGSRCALEAYHPNTRDPRLLYARHAIHRVERLLAHDPVQQKAVTERLEVDYRELEALWASAPTR